MNQSFTIKYPTRADMLALLKAREKGGAGPRANAAGRGDAPVCLTVVPALVR